MEQAAVAAERFETGDGRWRDGRDRLRASAKDMFEYWKKARDTAHASCDELAKGDENKDVVRAVNNLSRKRSDNATELGRVRAEHRKWYEDLSELRQFFKTDTRRTGTAAIKRALSGKKKADLTGDLEVFRACFDDSRGDAKLDRELRVYKYCPPEGELFHDFVVP